MLENLCTPALMYMAFSMIQIIIDIFSGVYNIAFFKFITMIIFLALLQILCIRGLGVISWIIVFIPFVLMTFVSMMLMSAFGFSDNTILDISSQNAPIDEVNQARLNQDAQHLSSSSGSSSNSTQINKESVHFSDTNQKLDELNLERANQDSTFKQ
jgi:hypothetical protein